MDVSNCRYCDVEYRRQNYKPKRACPECFAARSLERRQAEAAGRVDEFNARWFPEKLDRVAVVFEELYGPVHRELCRVFRKRPERKI